MVFVPRILKPLSALRTRRVRPEPIPQVRLVPGDDGDVRSLDIREPFILLLRPFDADAAIEAGNPGEWISYTAETIEHHLAAAAKRFGLPLVALRSPHSELRPTDLFYLVAGDDWPVEIERLIRHASVVLVLATKPALIDGTAHDGFDHELQLLAASSSADVVVVFPPNQHDANISGAKGSVLDALGWKVPDSLPLVAFRQGSKTAIVASLGTSDDALARRYVNGVATAIATLSGRSEVPQES